jgi:hypothetical protein
LSLTTNVSAASGYPDGQISTIAYTLPAEITNKLSQLPTCDPSLFLSASIVNLPTNCPDQAALVGTAAADGYAPAVASVSVINGSGSIVHTSGPYPLTLVLHFSAPKLQVNLAFGGTVSPAGVVTFDTTDAAGSPLGYGFPTLFSKYLAINGLVLAFPDTAGAFAATGCATGTWSFGESVTYAATAQPDRTYAPPGPPSDTAAASVACSSSTSAGGGNGSSTGSSSNGSGSAGPNSGSGGVGGATTTVPPSHVTRCVVPAVKAGATLSSVEALLRRAHCGVGRIVTKSSTNVIRHGKIVRRAVPKGRVIALSDRAGTKLRANTRVGITVSRG